jgi:Lrp/AsnC family leucine-responsive transcriptional regulator
VRVQDMAAYRKFLGTTLVTMPGVRETRTYAVLEQVKSTTQLPV